MARNLRVQFEGAIYHVTIRGVERRSLFTEDRERERFSEPGMRQERQAVAAQAQAGTAACVPLEHVPQLYGGGQAI